jgi:hypothetical protein
MRDPYADSRDLLTKIDNEDVKMDDEGGSCHLSISVIFIRKRHFYHTPLSMTRTDAMAVCFRITEF